METKEKTRPLEESNGSETVKVTVHIQAFALYNAPDQSTNQVNENTQFNDGTLGGCYGCNKKNYETDVNLGDWVVWDSKVADKKGIDKGYSVSIDNIVHDPTPGNPNFFNRKIICGVNGVVTVQVVDVDNDGVPDVYTINFSVTNPKGDTKYYGIDPKIKIIGGGQ